MQKNNHALLTRILSLIDLTSLNEQDTDATIEKLCQDAKTPFGNVAAVCVYPQFIKIAKKFLSGTNINIATVTNFPHGEGMVNDVIDTTREAIIHGANEIDLVLPYKAYLSGNRKCAIEMVKRSKEICLDKAKLKVILETGELKNPEVIASAALDAILAGADFIKTSTGKVKVNATLEAAAMMLAVIRPFHEQNKQQVGFKAAGGIRSVENAAEYLTLAENMMGAKWISPHYFRFGASGLLQDVIGKLKDLS